MGTRPEQALDTEDNPFHQQTHEKVLNLLSNQGNN